MTLREGGPAVEVPDRSEVAPTVGPNPPPSRKVPPGLEIFVDGLPDSYAESGTQGVMFSLSPDGDRTSPGYLRTWIKQTDLQSDLNYIIVLAESNSEQNPLVSPAAMTNPMQILSRRDVQVMIQYRGDKWDVRWTECGVDVRIILSGDDWQSQGSVVKLIGSVRVLA